MAIGKLCVTPGAVMGAIKYVLAIALLLGTSSFQPKLMSGGVVDPDSAWPRYGQYK